MLQEIFHDSSKIFSLSISIDRYRKSIFIDDWYRLPVYRLTTSVYLPTLTPVGWKLRSQPAHACGPISHAWLKNVSCCRLAWHNFQTYVNSDPCKERKPCVKWINDNTFLFEVKSTGSELAFGRLQDKTLTLIFQKKLAGIWEARDDCILLLNLSCHMAPVSMQFQNRRP